jgi:hypothetical protein
VLRTYLIELCEKVKKSLACPHVCVCMRMLEYFGNEHSTALGM